ncbi:hypothetical protein KR009_003490 [Drosophila setifemur]|nr:hypothetical protein KR009_003490 [Drosophila setifemur]
MEGKGRVMMLCLSRSASSGSGDDKPKSVPPGFAASEISGINDPSTHIGEASSAVLGSSSGSFGKTPEKTTVKEVTGKPGVKTAPVTGAVVKGVVKLGRTEPLDTTVLSKSECPESGSGSSGDNKKSDAERKAFEAKEAATKQLQDIVANLPSKQQTEKYFFRVVAFVYDLSFLTATWLVNFIQHNIVQNPKVQHYWKRFHEKMQQAKKD